MELKDSLDADSILNSHADIHFHNGHVFASGLRIAVAVFSIIGLFALISGGPGYLIGPVLLLAGAYVLTATYGTQISLSNNYVRNYTSSFGLKRGKWKPTVLFTDITILKMGRAISMTRYSTGESVSIDSGIFEVYLLTATHRQRILLCETKSWEEAIKTAEDLTEQMDKKLVPFNPVVSSKTRAMRYERH